MADGFTASVGQENQRPDLVRETFSLQGMSAIQAYDGSTGWQIQPFGGKKTPELMGEDDLRDLLLDADFDGPLVDYKEKGSTVEYLGHDQVDGDDALRLKITLKNGDIIYDYLDPDTFMEIRTRDSAIHSRLGARPRGGTGFVQAGEWSDVSRSRCRRGRRTIPNAQTVTVRKMEANVTIDPADFNLPESLKTEEKKSGIVGIH